MDKDRKFKSRMSNMYLDQSSFNTPNQILLLLNRKHKLNSHVALSRHFSRHLHSPCESTRNIVQFCFHLLQSDFRLFTVHLYLQTLRTLKLRTHILEHESLFSVCTSVQIIQRYVQFIRIIICVG